MFWWMALCHIVTGQHFCMLVKDVPLVPTVMESHGILASHGKWRESWKSRGILTICFRKKILELQK